MVDTAERMPSRRRQARDPIGESVIDDCIDAGGKELIRCELHLLYRRLIQRTRPHEGLAANNRPSVYMSSRGGKLEKIVTTHVIKLFGLGNVCLPIDSQHIHRCTVCLRSSQQLVAVSPAVELVIEAIRHQIRHGLAVVMANLIADPLHVEDGCVVKLVERLYQGLNLEDWKIG